MVTASGMLSIITALCIFPVRYKLSLPSFLLLLRNNV
jgi:hypothetical protein